MRQLRRYTPRNPVTGEGSNKPYLNPPAKIKSKPTAKEVLAQSIGDYLAYYEIRKLSEVLNTVFGRGWSVCQIYEYKKLYWIAGHHFIKNGKFSSYHLENIVQWHLDRQ
jgi:hypothetical protein